MNEFKIPINCNIISSGRESFGYNYYTLMKYVIKHRITSLFPNNSIHHCNSLYYNCSCHYSYTNNN